MAKMRIRIRLSYGLVLGYFSYSAFSFFVSSQEAEVR